MTLLSHGYVVIAPNVRGSTGYGADFEPANYKDLGGNDLKDEIAGIDFLKATGFVDPKRVGIWGPSYGGFMALMAIGKMPDLWAAAVDEYGILDWNSMYQRNTGGHQLLEGFMGDPTMMQLTCSLKSLPVESGVLSYIERGAEDEEESL